MGNGLQYKITRAVILAFDMKSKTVRYDSEYGGETLLNRSLVALSKSGISKVSLMIQEGQTENVEKNIQKINKRINLTITIHEITRSETCRAELNRIITDPEESFLMFDLTSIYHFSLFDLILKSNEQESPVLVCCKNVTWDNNGLHFEKSVKEKFKAVFSHPTALRKIILKSNRVKLPAVNDPNQAMNEPKYFSTDVLICRRKDLETLPDAESIGHILNHFETRNQLKAGWVENVWWLKITDTLPKEYITNYFWKIAFKEISGEFSKKINSILSKPLSFGFARLGFSPNVISIIAFLFLIGSSLLLFSGYYWALVLSGLLWQMAAVLDRCDGEVARIRSYETAFGARFDIVTDDLGYAVQFICLTSVCFMQSHNDPFYLIVSAMTILWILRAVLYEKDYMQEAGYQSRQVKHVDFLERLNPDSIFVRLFKNIEVFGRRDWRAVLYLLLTLTGSSMLIFWTFMIFGWVLGAFIYIQIHVLCKPEFTNSKSVSLFRKTTEHG